MQDGCNEGMGRACAFLLGVYLWPDAATPRVQAGVPDLRGASLRVSPSVATALRMAISNLRTSGRKGGIGALRQAGATLLRPLGIGLVDSSPSLTVAKSRLHSSAFPEGI